MQVFILLGCCQLRSDNAPGQLLWTVFHTLPENGVEYPDQLAACCNNGLFACQRILLPCSEILIDLTELCIDSHHGQYDLKQNLPQPLSSSLADGASAMVFAGTVLFELQPGQLLDLLR